MGSGSPVHNSLGAAMQMYNSVCNNYVHAALEPLQHQLTHACFHLVFMCT